jgi:hypothetical protein
VGRGEGLCEHTLAYYKYIEDSLLFTNLKEEKKTHTQNAIYRMATYQQSSLETEKYTTYQTKLKTKVRQSAYIVRKLD